MGLTRSGEGGALGDWRLCEEIAALAQGRVCRKEQRRQCRAENGAFADWACKECREFVRPEAISPWTWHVLFLHRLKRAGYPFRANDLDLETWMLLGLVEMVLGDGTFKLTFPGKKQGL